MDSTVITQLLGLAKEITAYLGEFEASGILSLIEKFFSTTGIASISELFNNIFGMMPL